MVQVSFIRDGQVVLDRIDEFVRAAMHAASDLFLGEVDEPAFDQIEPGSARRGEMDVIPRAFSEPTSDERRFVRRVVIENQMDIQVTRDGGVDRVKEPTEFAGAMARVTFANDAARPNIDYRLWRNASMACRHASGGWAPCRRCSSTLPMIGGSSNRSSLPSAVN